MDNVWLIVGASMVMVIGSVFWILPGPADRKRMILRQLAFQRGFKVKALQPDEILLKFAIRDVGKPLYYYFKPGLCKGYPLIHESPAGLVAVPKGDDWDFYSTGSSARIPTELTTDTSAVSFSDTVNCLYFDKKEVGMLWNEQADVEKTEKNLDSLLNFWSEVEGAEAVVI